MEIGIESNSNVTTEYIKTELQKILDRNHTNTIKRKIEETSKSIDCACPICGDSQKRQDRKRFTIYKNSLHTECFNCGHSSSFLGFLKHFGIQIDPQIKIKLLDYVDDNIQKVKWYEDQFITKSLDKMIPMKDLENYFNNDPKSVIKEFKPVQKGSKVYNYLNNRKITDHTNIYQGVFYRSPTWKENVLISINGGDGRVLGIQLRNLNTDRNKRMYKIYSFVELYNNVYTYPNNVLDEIEAHGYNKLSYMYNILNINWGDKITIFEGYLDTKFFPNSIGLVGTNTDVSFILNQEANIRFFYDHDKSGIKKAIEWIKKGFPVFLWDKLLEDWAKSSKNPYSAYRKLIANIVDLNDVAKLVKDPYVYFDMENYFAKDEIDLYLIKSIE